MLKLLGSILILGTASVFGQFLSSKESYALDDLYSFKKGFILLKSELSYLKTNLSDAFKNISGSLNYSVAEIFVNFSNDIKKGEVLDVKEIWDKSFNESKDKLYINQTMQKQIKDFGKVLEYQDLEAIINNIDFLISQIEDEIEISLIKNESTKKLYRQLSVLFGCVVVIVLI